MIRKLLIFCVLALCTVTLMPDSVSADNPIVQTRHTADPAPLVFKDTVYVYTGHDVDNSTWFVMPDWRCYSSKDLVNWTDEGSPLSSKNFSWAGDNYCWAGQCIERDGKFYYYVPMHPKGPGDFQIGVAVADNPTGPFKDALGRPLIATGYGNIDPTVFIDNDGQAYLYWGNPQLRYVKLNRDMISYDQTVGKVDVPLTPGGFGSHPGGAGGRTNYVEGPWFYRRGDLYYMAYAAGGIPEFLAYSTSTSPTGPWTYRGIIMPNHLPNLAFTNQLGIFDFKGKSYMFYHNQNLPGGGGFDRSVCLESFAYNPDGSIPTILPTKAGPPSASPLNPFNETRAATIAWEVGIQTETSDTAGVYVTNIEDGSFIKVETVDFGKKGAGAFAAKVAGGGSGGSIEVHLDRVDGVLIAALPVTDTGDWSKWKTYTTKVTRTTGIHGIYFVFKGAPGQKLFDFASWKFSK
jgi:hypothetical protein